MSWTTTHGTCDDCGFSGSVAELGAHSCYVQEMGGQCEDYPCCGHTDGDGCQTRPEHTAAYWSGLRDRMGDDEYDRMTEAMDRQEADW